MRGRVLAQCFCHDEESKDTIVATWCGHTFHEECIRKWKQTKLSNRLKPTCPTCSQSLARVPKSNFIKLHQVQDRHIQSSSPIRPSTGAMRRGQTSPSRATEVDGKSLTGNDVDTDEDSDAGDDDSNKSLQALRRSNVELQQTIRDQRHRLELLKEEVSASQAMKAAISELRIQVTQLAQERDTAIEFGKVLQATNAELKTEGSRDLFDLRVSQKQCSQLTLRVNKLVSENLRLEERSKQTERELVGARSARDEAENDCSERSTLLSSLQADVNLLKTEKTSYMTELSVLKTANANYASKVNALKQQLTSRQMSVRSSQPGPSSILQSATLESMPQKPKPSSKKPRKIISLSISSDEDDLPFSFQTSSRPSNPDRHLDSFVLPGVLSVAGQDFEHQQVGTSKHFQNSKTTVDLTCASPSKIARKRPRPNSIVGIPLNSTLVLGPKQRNRL